ncbi:MAG: tRNA (adenosine(37)-N6)-threonylcarbamoyltransferase complex dimerization subunit type 1 TsaB [Gammaproteobacteria bacterium]|jgi:tRNA threonylcarbamoyladenosine biosynthesis protein TsaB
MRLLAIDTATEACSAALWIDGECREQYRVAPREHTRLILPMTEALLADAGIELGELDALAFGRGPGAFTGVRIAAGVVQGLAMGADLPVVAVSDLAALAAGAARATGESHVVACIDARMGEVYAGSYRIDAPGLAHLIGEERVCAPEALDPPDGAWYVAGSGMLAYGDILRQSLGARLAGADGELLPHAADIAALAVRMRDEGAGVAAEQALPVYLRDQVATSKAGP